MAAGDQGADNTNHGTTSAQPVGFTKPKKFLFFKIRSKPIYNQQQAPSQPKLQPQSVQQAQAAPQQPFQKAPSSTPKNYTPFQIYIARTAARHKDLELSLRQEGIKSSPYDFVKRMFIYAASLAIIIALVGTIAIYLVVPKIAILMPVLGIAVFMGAFNKFIQYPIDKNKTQGKDVERDIMFAVRDIVIGMRSGMPLYNAMTAVSTGYGAASSEFAKIVELVQLGTPIEQSIEEVSARSSSRTFKRMMLQASVSIRSGADIVSSMQSVLDEVSQERVIELRRYGQRLNALAMFYMLFGVIFPSMGIAVAAILTTFINIFTVNLSTLIAGLIFIFFLQIVFLNIMRSSRPTFAV
ncbi:MAG: type II secretion system F family protein [Candidatus Micrarchaeota archaeon]|nr:type II secretion system F family protein [Candidatus Micrarchaeota archaeon]